MRSIRVSDAAGRYPTEAVLVAVREQLFSSSSSEKTLTTNLPANRQGLLAAAISACIRAGTSEGPFSIRTALRLDD